MSEGAADPGRPQVLGLRTAGTRCTLAVVPSGTGIRAAGWGADTGQDHPAPPLEALDSFATPEDLEPHEFSVAGTRHVRASDLLVRWSDGIVGSRVHLDSVPRLVTDAAGDRLQARLVDVEGALRIDLDFATCFRHDVITRRVRVTNTDPEREVTLVRALSGAFCLHLPDGAEVTTWTGDWSREDEQITTLVRCGVLSLGSRQGITSHRAAPAVMIQDPRAPERGCWSVALGASGSWTLEVDAEDRDGWLRVAAGAITPEAPATLAPGQNVELPELLGLWAPDADAAARAWHRFARTALLHDVSAAHRPVTYNSWYATGFDVRCEQQLELADRAARIGCEMFVLDDGWFRGRRDDTRALGDWQVDPEAFPEGLTPLVEGVHERGMRFGLWIEPEGVSPDSDLFRAHPEWIHRSPEREPVTMRHQYVLDLGRPEVEQWCRQMLRDLLTGSGIDHLKWDMNRAITDGGGPLAATGDHWMLAHVAAYHRILDMLRSEFPQVTIEGCAGGGGRIDSEVLRRTDVVWPSDETGPRDRLVIQHGFLALYPAAVMSSWVTDLDGTRDDRPATWTYRMCVALCGVPGIGADLSALDEQALAELTSLVAVAREVRPVVLGGEAHRYGNPRAHGYALEFGQAPGDGRGVLVVFGEPGDASAVRIRPQFADARTHPLLQAATAGQARWVQGADGDEVEVHLDPEAGAAVVILQQG